MLIALLTQLKKARRKKNRINNVKKGYETVLELHSVRILPTYTHT